MESSDAAQPIAFTTMEAFEIERMSRKIDELVDVGQLRTVAKALLSGWIHQKAATAWMMRQPAIAPLQMPPDVSSASDVIDG